MNANEGVFRMDIEPGAVVITTTKMYDELRDVHRTVTDTKTVVDRVADSVTDIRADINDHEVRIRSLERARWTIGGVSAAFGATLALVAQSIGKG